MITPEFILQLIIAVGSAFGVYGAIRSDLAAALIRAEQAQKDADAAHDRLDRHIEAAH